MTTRRTVLRLLTSVAPGVLLAPAVLACETTQRGPTTTFYADSQAAGGDGTQNAPFSTMRSLSEALIALPVSAEPLPAAPDVRLVAWPNPARRGRGSVTVEVSAATAVRVDVLDALGRQVGVLIDGPVETGRYRLSLPGGLTPGRYVVRSRSASGQSLASIILF